MSDIVRVQDAIDRIDQRLALNDKCVALYNRNLAPDPACEEPIEHPDEVPSAVVAEWCAAHVGDKSFFAGSVCPNVWVEASINLDTITADPVVP